MPLNAIFGFKQQSDVSLGIYFGLNQSLHISVLCIHVFSGTLNSPSSFHIQTNLVYDQVKFLIFLALLQALPEHCQTSSIVMSVSLHIQQNNRVTNCSSHRARVLVNDYRHKRLALLQYLNSENVCHVNICIEKRTIELAIFTNLILYLALRLNK